MQKIINLLRSNNYITVNKTLIKKIGLLPATMYGELLSRYYYFEQNNLLKNGYFYLMIEDAKEEIGLSREEQDTAIRKLVKLGLIKKQVRKFRDDTTTRRYFKIVEDYDLVLGLFDEPKKEKNTPKSIDTTMNVEITQSGLSKSHNHKSVNHTTLQYNNNKDIILNKNSQSVSPDPKNIDTPQKPDLENDNQEINQIIDQAQVDLYEDEPLKEVIKDTITKAYQDKTTRTTIKKLKLNHIDRAIEKYRAMQEQQEIKNPKLYFLRCLLSAIQEEGLSNLF